MDESGIDKIAFGEAHAIFTIVGTKSVGNYLSIKRESDDPNGINFLFYTWQKSSDGYIWNDIGSKSSYRIKYDESNKYIRAVLSYTDDDGTFKNFSTDPFLIEKHSIHRSIDDAKNQLANLTYASDLNFRDFSHEFGSANEDILDLKESSIVWGLDGDDSMESWSSTILLGGDGDDTYDIVDRYRGLKIIYEAPNQGNSDSLYLSSFDHSGNYQAIIDDIHLVFIDGNQYVFVLDALKKEGIENVYLGETTFYKPNGGVSRSLEEMVAAGWKELIEENFGDIYQYPALDSAGAISDENGPIHKVLDMKAGSKVGGWIGSRTITGYTLNYFLSILPNLPSYVGNLSWDQIKIHVGETVANDVRDAINSIKTSLNTVEDNSDVLKNLISSLEAQAYDLNKSTEEVSITSKTVGDSYHLTAIRDYDGNFHANTGSVSDKLKSAYKYQGKIDVNNDGILEAIYTNNISGRWVTTSIYSSTEEIDYSDHGQGGTTRVVGIYIDPLVSSGEVEQFGPHDSQRRFQNDLEIDNLSVKTAGDYDSDGFQEVYWKTHDGTAYLRALMHADGNIQYANYQSEDQMSDYLTAQGHKNVIAEIM